MIEGMLLALDVLGMLLLIRWSLAQDAKLRSPAPRKGPADDK